MSEQQPKLTPINEILKSVLLGERQIAPWIEQLHADLSLELTGDYPREPLEKRSTYQELWPFSKMSIEDISKLSTAELAEKLAMLETEDQDMLVGKIPRELEDAFWKLIDNS